MFQLKTLKKLRADYWDIARWNKGNDMMVSWISTFYDYPVDGIIKYSEVRNGGGYTYRSRRWPTNSMAIQSDLLGISTDPETAVTQLFAVIDMLEEGIPFEYAMALIES